MHFFGADLFQYFRAAAQRAGAESDLRHRHGVTFGTVRGRAPGLSCIPCLVTDHGHWQDEKAALTQLNTELTDRL